MADSETREINNNLDISDDNEEIVAVIMAVVAGLTNGRVVVTTIRRAGEQAVPLWSLAGRQTLMNNWL